MPAYVLHGFRWPREGFTGIRVHAIVHNLEDCSVEYIQNHNSKDEIIGSFRKLYPELMRKFDDNGTTLDLIEQYDPSDIVSAQAVSQPYAFVADQVIALADGQEAGTLSLNIEEEINAHPITRSGAVEVLADLRDKIAEGEKIGWWIVYNGDPDRGYDSEHEEEESEVEEEEAATPVQTRSPENPSVSKPPESAPVPNILSQDMVMRGKSTAAPPDERKETIPDPPKLKEVAQKTGFRRKFFGRKT